MSTTCESTQLFGLAVGASWMPTAGLPSSRLSNDLTPTASLPLLVPTPIVSPAERSPTGLGCQIVEFCRRGNVWTWRQLQIEEPCKVIFLSEKKLFFGRNRWKESGFSVLTRYFLLTWFSFTKDLFFSKYFEVTTVIFSATCHAGQQSIGLKGTGGRAGKFLGVCWKQEENDMDVSKNNGTPKPSILIGFSIINHLFWGYHYFWKHPHHTLSSSVYKLYIWRSSKTLDFHGGGFQYFFWEFSPRKPLGKW